MVNDVLDLAFAKTALDISGSKDEAMLASCITALSKRLDECVGPIIQRAVVNEEHDGGKTAIELHFGPAATIASVVEYRGTDAVTLDPETPGVLPANGFKAERHDPDPTLLSGLIWRRTAGSDTRFAWGRGNVLVSYTAGRFATLDDVTDNFLQAATVMLRNWWGMYELTAGNPNPDYDTPTKRFPTFAVPNAIEDLLFQEWRDVGTFR